MLRFTPTGTQKFQVDLTNIEAINSEIFYIKPKDLINIKPLKQKSWGTGKTGLETFTTVFTVFSFLTSTILIIRSF